MMRMLFLSAVMAVAGGCASSPETVTQPAVHSPPKLIIYKTRFRAGKDLTDDACQAVSPCSPGVCGLTPNCVGRLYDCGTCGPAADSAGASASMQ